MTWPQSPTTLARPSAASPVSSTLQDQFMDAIEGGIHGDRTYEIPATALISSAALTYGVGPTEVRLEAQAWCNIVPLRVGDRLKSVTYSRFGNGAADLSVVRVTILSSGADDNIVNTNDDDFPAAWGNKVLTPATPRLIAAGESAVLYLFPSVAAVIKLKTISFVIDHP